MRLGSSLITVFFCVASILGLALAYGTIDKSGIINLIENDMTINGVTYVLVDVRGRDEVAATSLIGNAINIPLPEVEEALDLDTEAFLAKYNQKKPSVETIITYCKAGSRAEKAAHIFENKGYEALFYPGSYNDWIKTFLRA